MAFLEIDKLHKSFGANIALHHFDMQIERGEFITFLGPSGCGKTTVLRMIAGFETPTRGTIHLDGRDVTHLRTRERAVGMVFQSYALFPNMTVAREHRLRAEGREAPAAGDQKRASRTCST